MAVARLGSIALDCAEPMALAAFWAELLGGEVAVTSGTSVAVKTGRTWLAAVHVEGYQAPSWPDGGIPKQMHVDLAVDDLDQAEVEAVRLGQAEPRNNRHRTVGACCSIQLGTRSALSMQIPE